MKCNLRISLVTETYFPQINGVSRTLDRLVRHCVGAGDQVQVLLPRYSQGSSEIPTNVEFHDWRAIPLPFYPEILLPLATPAMVARRLGSFCPDLVHIATEGPLGWAAQRAAHRLNLPVVSSYHTNFADYLAMYRAKLLASLCWGYLRRFHNNTLMTFCPTATTRRELEARGFRNVSVWGRGVDGECFHPAKRDAALRSEFGIGPDDVVLVYVGRLAAEKNIEMLMDAWQRLPEKDRCWLLFVGDGPLRQRIEEQSGHRWLFAGYRQGDELARYYASADLLVFPSLTETFGNVVLEAMASGLPAIGFAVQGPGDIIGHGNTGLLVNNIQADSLMRAMSELILNPSLRREMGASARRYAEAQSWERIMGGLRADYWGVLGMQPSSNSCQSLNLGKTPAKQKDPKLVKG